MNSRESSELPLVVNCAGKVDISEPFTTYNARGRSDYYLMYVTDGRLEMELSGEEITVSGGDFIIFPPHYKYRYTLKSGRIVYYFVHFTGSHPKAFLSKLGLSELPVALHAGYSEQIAECFSNIFGEYMQTGDFRELELQAELERILIGLCRLRSAKNEAPLSRSLSYIRTSYTTEIRIPELAAMESLSVSRYNALFKKAIGVSPVSYINDMRIKHACSLLDTTDLPIKTVGEIVGWQDNHFFSKVFKAHVGMSASEYRKKSLT